MTPEQLEGLKEMSTRLTDIVLKEGTHMWANEQIIARRKFTEPSEENKLLKRKESTVKTLEILRWLHIVTRLVDKNKEAEASPAPEDVPAETVHQTMARVDTEVAAMLEKVRSRARK